MGTRFLCGVIKNTLKIRLCQQVHNSVNVDSILNITFPKRTVACELHLHHFSFSKENDKAVYKVNTPEPLGHATPRISLSSLEALGCVFFWTPSYKRLPTKPFVTTQEVPWRIFNSSDITADGAPAFEEWDVQLSNHGLLPVLAPSTASPA